MSSGGTVSLPAGLPLTASPRVAGTYGTSSIAQGGGGSLKNRKPIGEVGCRESRMEEQKH